MRILIVPTLRARRYTQVPSDQKRRHSGRDCRNPEAKEGKLVAEQVFDFGNLQPTVSHPCGLDSGNPCRNDVPPTLVYNGERSSVGMPPKTLQRRRYRTAGAVKAAFPRWSVTAINKGCD